MADLQSRLDKAFGALDALGSSQQPAWRPAERQVFRSGAPRDGNSSDEEYEERQRRESVPGLAQSLVEEDTPDAEGFRPSTAFCRALDAEEEYNEVDEVATGLLARRRGGEALPPRDTQVLADNIYEQRAAAAAAAQAAEGMEVEEAAAKQAAATPAGPAVGVAAGSSRSSLAGGRASTGGEAGEAGERRKVRFEGVAAPYVPPSRRPGFQPRCTDLPPTGPEDEQAAAGGQHPPQWRQHQRQQRQSLSSVPDHVKHPDRYICYVLDEPLVVGGGVAQLAGEQHNARPEAGPVSEAGGEEAEPERWVGPVGVAGAVQFQPRQKKADGAGAAASMPAAGGSEVAAQRPTLQFDDEAAAAEEEGGGDEAAMEADPAPAPAKTKKKHYRSSRPEADD